MILHGMLIIALPYNTYNLKWWVYYNISSNYVIRKNCNLETIQPYQHGTMGPLSSHRSSHISSPHMHHTHTHHMQKERMIKNLHHVSIIIIMLHVARVGRQVGNQLASYMQTKIKYEIISFFTLNLFCMKIFEIFILP